MAAPAAAVRPAPRLGRPRQVEDEAVFAAMAKVLLRVGWARLTLTVVARELGVTPAALRQRFGAKHDLLVAFYAWGTARLRATVGDLVDRPHPARPGSPLEVLRAMIRGSIEPFATPEQMVNAISAFSDVAGQADLRPLAQERFALALSGTEVVLGQAIARGELAGIDAPRLARLLQVSLIGASLVWSVTGRGTIRDELLAVADQVLAPYRHEPAPPVRRGRPPAPG